MWPRQQSSQPPSVLTLTGLADYRRAMCGAWFFSSPGVGGRIHNYAPNASAITQTTAVVHGIINNPYASNGWRNQQDCVSLETSDNVAVATGTYVELGDPIATGDNVSILMGWIPASTAIPSGTNVGTMFVRGQDGSGNGWSIFLRHDGTNQISFATVMGGAQQTAAGANAGLRPGIPNYACGRVRQGVDVAVAVNGSMRATTGTGNTSLRTSGVGCRFAGQTSAGNTSHCDPLLFGVLWRRALTDIEMAFITAYPWTLWALPDFATDMYTSGPGQLQGAASITLSPSGSLTSGINLGGTAPVTLNPTGTLTSGIQLVGNAPITIAPAGVLKAGKVGRGLKNCGHAMFTKCERQHLGEES